MRFVPRVSAKNESSDVAFGTRDAVRVGVQAGSLMRAAHQGIWEKCAIASVMVRWTVEASGPKDIPIAYKTEGRECR